MFVAPLQRKKSSPLGYTSITVIAGVVLKLPCLEFASVARNILSKGASTGSLTKLKSSGDNGPLTLLLGTQERKVAHCIIFLLHVRPSIR